MTELLWYHYALAISVGVYVFQLALAELIYRVKGPIPDDIEYTWMASPQAHSPIGRNPSVILTIPMLAPQFGIIVFGTYALAGSD